MSSEYRYGVEQARAQLPMIVSEASAGSYTVITRHGKPSAAVVSIAELEALLAARRRLRGVLALRGSGRALWGRDSGQTIAGLREDWEGR
jgi:prevent-host-death family protein